jgi:acetoin utilization deacetylase AcuC-like enzyme
MNAYTLEAALRSAGAGILATDLVMSGDAKRAFCNVRPPGHHAEKDTAMGFCFFNNIAVAAMHAIEHHGLERVAIVDFDVHHGNGTEDILAENENVLFCSTYQHPFYPGYAGKSVEKQVVNVPLPEGTSGPEFRFAVQKHWLPALSEFKPQLILISAGFDAHKDDEMGGFTLVDDDYVWVSKKICAIADEFAEGRIVSMLEGGYNLQALARCATAHVRVMMGL